MTPHEVTVRAGAGDYPVVVGRDLLSGIGDRLADRVPGVRRWAVISDERVSPLYGEPVRASLDRAGFVATMHEFPAGEPSKSREQWSTLTDGLLDAGLGRDGGVVAVGGGVTGDLAGFVAATYMRGLPVVQVPTSIVAMVDSAVGGKTGVDTPAGKNLVGAFHPPRLVLIDADTVGTLPRRERAQGWAEALKHGAIIDRGYFDALVERAPDLMDGDPDAVQEAVLRSVQIKSRVVSGDERESGQREILNFGHTLGHALEARSGYRLPHGSAVGLGMVLEARVGEFLGITEPKTGAALAQALQRFDLPTSPDGALMAGEQFGALLARDKKVRAGRVRVVLLAGLGDVAPPGGGDQGWAHPVEVQTLLAAVGSG